MSFLAIALVLLIEQLRPLPYNRALGESFGAWSDWAARNFDAGRQRHAWVVVGVAVGVPTLVVALLHWGLLQLGALGTTLDFVFQVGVLYLTLGFRHFSHYFTDVRAALERGDELSARLLLGEWLKMRTADLGRRELLREVLEQSLLAAHRHVFGVIVWYLALAALGFGPAGAVLYRLAGFARQRWLEGRGATEGAWNASFEISPKLSQVSALVFDVLDAVPARVTAFGFALAGDFEAAVEGWRHHAPVWLRSADGVILASAAGALGVRLGSGSHGVRPPGQFATTSSDTDGAAFAMPGASAHAGAARAWGHTPGAEPSLAHLRNVVGLVWRSVLMGLGLLALVTLTRWLA